MSIFQRVVLVLLSSLLAALVFPPFGFWGLAAVAWVPLFLALRGLSGRPAFYLGLLQGVALYGITLSWMWNIFSTTSILLWTIMGLFVGLSCMVMVSTRLRGAWGGLFCAAVWVGFEFTRSEIYALHFPWITPGVGLPPLWLTPLIGVYGVSFLVVLGGLFVLEKGRLRLAGAVLLGGLLVSGVCTREAEIGDVKVVAVQNEGGYYKEFIQQTRAAMKGADFVVWPELAVTELLLEEREMLANVKALSRDFNGVLVVGAYTRADADHHFNSAISLQHGEVIGEHHKNRLVPLFAEGVAGREARALDTKLGRVGTPICFDNDHEDVVRRMVADGAEALIVPSLDAKDWSARQHDQHAELFRHRAAENHRWIVVAASSGMSQIIDPWGNRIASIPLMEKSVLQGEIQLLKGRTFYNRYGWVLGWICVAAAAAGLAQCVFYRVKPLLHIKRLETSSTY